MYDSITLMKKIIILLVCLSHFPSLSIAETLEEKRRVEEEKREDLRPSEVQIREGKVALSPRAPFDPIDIVYFAKLMPKKVVFRYDACKALVVLVGVEDEYIDLNSQVAFLKKRNLLPKKHQSEFDPMQPLRRGLVAYMFCEALDIKGGLILRIFGMSQRYALKELAFQGIMSSGNVNDIVSGEELVLVFTQAVQYMEQKQSTGMEKPKE